MKDIWLLTVGFIAASTTGSSAMEVKGITTVTLTDGSVEAVSGAKKVTFKMITLDDHWEEQKLLETPATPMELCSDSSGTQQVGPTQLDEVPKTPLDAVVSTATPQEPHSQLAGWRRTVHSAARECMQEIQVRVALAEVYNKLEDYPIYTKLVDLCDGLRSDPTFDKSHAHETLRLARMYLYLCDLESDEEA